MRLAIGQHIYVHLSAPSGNLIISAHGTGRGCGTFQVPRGMTLNFYGTHGNALLDASIGHALDGYYGVREKISEGQTSHDYYLKKFQGRHSGWNETYSSLDENLWKARARHFDVLTIRNRPLSWNPISLSSVLRRLSEVGCSYRRVYCLICRHVPGGEEEYPVPAV